MTASAGPLAPPLGPGDRPRSALGLGLVLASAAAAALVAGSPWGAPAVVRAVAVTVPAPPGAEPLYATSPTPAVSLAVFRADGADALAAADRYRATLVQAGFAAWPADGPASADAGGSRSFLLRRGASFALVSARPGQGGQGALITVAESRASASGTDATATQGASR